MKYVIICRDKSHSEKPITLWIYKRAKDYYFYLDYFRKHEHWDIIHNEKVNNIKEMEE